MSEEVKQEEPAVVAKESRVIPQYLLMVDEVGVAMLSKLMPSLLFVHIEGMSIPDNQNHQLLVTPIKKPLDKPAEVIEAPPQE